jgi:hypothetical protein
MLLVSISARTVGVEERSTQLGETATFLQPIASVSSAQSGSERGRAFIQLIYATITICYSHARAPRNLPPGLDAAPCSNARLPLRVVATSKPVERAAFACRCSSRRRLSSRLSSGRDRTARRRVLHPLGRLFLLVRQRGCHSGTLTARRFRRTASGGRNSFWTEAKLLAS